MKRKPMSEAALKRVLVEAMRGIIASGVTSSGVRDSSRLTFDDLIVNFHLCERLSNAFGAMKALRGYNAPDYEFVLASDAEYEAAKSVSL